MTAVRELDGAPSTALAYTRAAAAMVPGASHLPFVGGGGGELPDVELHRPAVRVDADHLAAYARVCGFRLTGTLPATYPHVLAFGLQMALMTDAAFPFAPVGLVHVANRIVAHRPIDVGETLDLRVRPAGLRAHRAGRAFELVSEARVGDELVWEGFSTMLRRGKRDESVAREEAWRDVTAPAVAMWRLDGGLGRRYAAASGDRNPIHMHNVSAKLLGFPRAIAHGMWTKARCLAALEGRLPDAFAVDVRFRKPILLPATVAFAYDGERFGVRDAKRDLDHLDGLITTEGSDR